MALLLGAAGFLDGMNLSFKILYDGTRNEMFTNPKFDDRMSYENRLQERIDQTIYEDVIPPIPTREQELEYLEL